MTGRRGWWSRRGVASRSARFFAAGAQRILDEALASLTHLYEERVRRDATETGASVSGTSVELHYTDAYVGTLRAELSKRRAELHLARSEVLSLRGLFANCSREAGNWREYADQLEQDYDRRGEELRNRTRELDEARAELAVVAAERENFSAEVVRKQEELSGVRVQMAKVQHEVERLRAVEGELAVARQEISAARATGEELPLVREELAKTKKELAMAQTAGEELTSVREELAKVRKELAVARIAAEEMPSVREELTRAKEELTKAKEELESAASEGNVDGLSVERDRAVEDLGVMRRKRKVTKMKFRYVRRVCRQARQIEEDLEVRLHSTEEEAGTTASSYVGFRGVGTSAGLMGIGGVSILCRGWLWGREDGSTCLC
jgi:chromosome segregation ATPase